MEIFSSVLIELRRNNTISELEIERDNLQLVVSRLLIGKCVYVTTSQLVISRFEDR